MKKIAIGGFTLVEMLIVVVILGVVAKAALPLLSSNDPQKLNVAAEETANILRFALSEAKRTNGYVLVDGKTTIGKLALYYSNANGEIPPTLGTSAIIDPLTKRVAMLDVTRSAFSAGVTLEPNFKPPTGAMTLQLLIGPGLSQLQVFDGPYNSKGALKLANIELSYGGTKISVQLNGDTGLVTLP